MVMWVNLPNMVIGEKKKISVFLFFFFFFKYNEQSISSEDCNNIQEHLSKVINWKGK